MSSFTLGLKKAQPGIFLNELLSSLKPDRSREVFSSLEPVELRPRQVLYTPGQHIREIYFPETCVIAMMTVMKDGDTIEAATVGREGASWISASLKSQRMPCETIVAIGGRAYKIPSHVVELEIQQNGDFHDSLSVYAHALLIQALRSAACNALHTIEQRCSRWMLTTLDRTGVDDFAITHEFLASLLGVRRSSVSQLVERLVAKGILRTSRGQISVANRSKLEQITCECYRIVREYYEEMAH
jgi:CRP-like cAMP-binding protein